MHGHQSCAAIVVMVGLMALTGCQSYQPHPLNSQQSFEDWSARSPQSEEVAAFARRLAERSGIESPFESSDGVTLGEAELIALVFNPDLRLARLRVDAAQAGADHAKRWDDPEFELDVLRVTESVSDPWIVSPGLAITIPISGRLEAEQARANAAVQAELSRVAEAEWRVRHEVRRAWLRWSATMAYIEETQKFLESTLGLVESTAALSAAGEMLRTEASLFVLEQAQRRQDLRRLQAEAMQQESELHMLLGLSPESPLQLVAGLDAPFQVDAESFESESFLDRNLTLRRLQDEYAIAERTLEREIRKQIPDLTIGPLYEDDQGQSRIGFLGGIPLPLLNANRRGIAEAFTARENARAEFEIELQHTAGLLAIARMRLRATQEQLAEATSVIAPMVDQQLSDARRLLELGEGGGLVLLESLGRAHEAKLNLIDLHFGEELAKSEMEFLIGPPESNDSHAIAGQEANP